MKNGGKANSLTTLVKAGFQVPSFFVCDSNWSKKKIYEAVDSVLPTVNFFAVRSSADIEDSETQSYAGHFYSRLAVSRKDVYKEVEKVIDSFGNETGKVIVQEFIPSEKAGVLFTEVENKNMIINSTIGLCQSVVNGYACDEYLCSKRGELISKHIAKQKEAQIFVTDKIVSKKIDSESLSIEEIKQLTTIGNKIEKLFGAKQDIEWCFKNNNLYILQARPITRDFTIIKDSVYFDSANIAESYSGIVLPLTQTFAKMVYMRVYIDLLKHSGVSGKKIEQRKDIFENLLDFFYGRMYYNMNNWYLMAAFIPGYKRNKENFERMITSNTKHTITTSIKPSRAFTLLYPFIVCSKMIIYGLTAKRFNTYVKREIKKLRNQNTNILSYRECLVLYESINSKLLSRWYITVENDFLVMTYLGLLTKMLGEQVLQKSIVFKSKATEQVTELSMLSKKMSTKKLLWKAINDNDVKTFTRELSKYNDITTLLHNYLETFGGRFANELKLESVGIDEDTSMLFSVLKAYNKYTSKPVTIQKDRNLPLVKKIVTNFILAKFKKYASRREEFRLLRSNAFAMARRIFRRMGEILVQNDIIESIDDVFYLTIDELTNPLIIKNKGLAQIIHERKKEYETYKLMNPPSYFVTAEDRPPEKQPHKIANKRLTARPASPGIIKGKVKIFKDFSMPDKIDFDILVTSHTDPGWTSLIALSKGLIIEHGGVLSHASIVARELNIPAVIGAKDAMTSLKNYQMVEIDGSLGTIKLL